MSLVVGALAGVAVFGVGRRVAATQRPPLDHWLAILTPAILTVLVLAAVEFVDAELNITGVVLAVVSTAGQAIAVVLTAWSAFVLCTSLAETGIASSRIRDESFGNRHRAAHSLRAPQILGSCPRIARNPTGMHPPR